MAKQSIRPRRLRERLRQLCGRSRFSYPRAQASAALPRCANPMPNPSCYYCKIGIRRGTVCNVATMCEGNGPPTDEAIVSFGATVSKQPHDRAAPHAALSKESPKAHESCYRFLGQVYDAAAARCRTRAQGFDNRAPLRHASRQYPSAEDKEKQLVLAGEEYGMKEGLRAPAGASSMIVDTLASEEAAAAAAAAGGSFLGSSSTDVLDATAKRELPRPRWVVSWPSTDSSRAPAPPVSSCWVPSSLSSSSPSPDEASDSCSNWSIDESREGPAIWWRSI